MESPAQKTYVVAVLGTGSIGSRHLDVLRTLGGAQGLAIPRRPARAQELETQGGAVTGSLEQAADSGAGLCIIATETGRHVEDGLQALKLGFDVLMEKPLASDSAGARLLNEAAAKAKRKLYVGCVMRFSESLNIFRDRLPTIGDVHSVRIECQSYLPDWRPNQDYRDSYSARAVEGGVLLDLIHEVDYAGWIFGWPEGTRGKLTNTGRLGIESEEVAELNWATPSGTSVSIMLDYLSRTPNRRMRAFGSEGELTWDGIVNRVSLQLVGKSQVIENSDQERNAMFSAQTTAFIDAIAGAQDGRLASSDEGVWALAVCDAARRSSDSGQIEKVEY